MRFSLFSLLTTVTAVAVCLAIMGAHGLFGFVLALPHFVAVTSVAWLVRRNQRGVASLVGAAYVACWAITALWGIPSVRQDLELQVVDACQTRRIDYRELPRVESDAWWDDPKLFDRKPWWFVGNETSPCPFVAAVDYGALLAPTYGSGGRYYVVWFFGFRKTVHHQFRWSS